jgi:hypothetical protein
MLSSGTNVVSSAWIMIFSRILSHRIVRNLEDHGFAVTAKKVLLTILAPIFTSRSYLIYMRNLQDLKPAAVRNTGLEFMWLQPEDEGEIKQIGEMEEWLSETLKSKLIKGAICLAAMDGGTVAGFNLIDLQEMTIPLLHFKRKLCTGSAWSDHISVNKAYRKSGLGSDLRNLASIELAARGIRRFYGSTQPDNLASLRLATNTGFMVFCRIKFVKLLSFKKWFFKRVR